MPLPIGYGRISRSFGTTQALAPLDLDIGSGEFVAVVGPSGCGKSTLLRLTADLDKPGAGTVSFGDGPPSAARGELRLGLVSQHPAVLPWNRANDDVTFTRKITSRLKLAAGELLRDFGLTGHEGKRPHEHSGGMLQRVNFAFAIAHDPDVLLMDEPFSALDEMKREELGRWLSRHCAPGPRRCCSSPTTLMRLCCWPIGFW